AGAERMPATKIQEEGDDRFKPTHCPENRHRGAARASATASWRPPEIPEAVRPMMGPARLVGRLSAAPGRTPAVRLPSLPHYTICEGSVGNEHRLMPAPGPKPEVVGSWIGRSPGFRP